MQNNKFEEYAYDFYSLITQLGDLIPVRKCFFFAHGLPLHVKQEVISAQAKFTDASAYTSEHAVKTVYAFLSFRDPNMIHPTIAVPSLSYSYAQPSMNYVQRQNPVRKHHFSRGRLRTASTRRPFSRSAHNNAQFRKFDASGVQPQPFPSAKHGGKSSYNCFNFGKPGHFSTECRGPCGNCGIYGHISKNCPKHKIAKLFQNWYSLSFAITSEICACVL